MAILKEKKNSWLFNKKSFFNIPGEILPAQKAYITGATSASGSNKISMSCKDES